MGAHNVLNVLAACAVSGAAGATVEAMRAVATSFKGVSHRLQLVAEIGGARYYDDSIATAPERLMAALRCFEQKVILLCGGRDKHLPWDEAAQLMRERCKHVVLFGEMGPMVAEHLAQAGATQVINFCTSLADAVSEAAKSRPQVTSFCSRPEAPVTTHSRTSPNAAMCLRSSSQPVQPQITDNIERG